MDKETSSLKLKIIGTLKTSLILIVLVYLLAQTYRDKIRKTGILPTRGASNHWMLA
jgi:hypothetical protein